MPICVCSQWCCYICYMESTLRSKRILLGHRKCYPRAKMLPNSTELSSELLSLPKPSLLWGLCMLALFISCDCSGPCAEDNYSNADRRSVVFPCFMLCPNLEAGFPAKAARSHQKGETLKLQSSWQNGVLLSSSSPFLKHARFCFDSDIHYNS